MDIRQVVVTGQRQVVLQTADLDKHALGADELLIESEATFVSAGTELANYTGADPDVFVPGKWCAYPWRSGYANVGIVRAVGPNVTRAAVGDRVFSYGNHASMVRYNQARMLIQVPEDLSSDLAAASRMVGVAMTAPIVSENPANAWVAVFGLGAVGNLAAQLYQILGCRVIGIDPVDHRRDLAVRCGIATTIGGTPEQVREQVLAMTDGQGADITVDAVGHSAVVREALHATTTQGQLVILGTPRVPVEGNLTELLTTVHRRRITVHGALEWRLPMYSGIEGQLSQFSKQQIILDWVRRGRIRLEPLISHRLSPDKIRDAYEGLLTQPNLYTGVALIWSSPS